LTRIAGGCTIIGGKDKPRWFIVRSSKIERCHLSKKIADFVESGRFLVVAILMFLVGCGLVGNRIYYVGTLVVLLPFIPMVMAFSYRMGEIEKSLDKLGRAIRERK
jgi:hypothetical protein